MQLSRTRLVAGVAAAALPFAVLAGCGEDEPKPKFEEPTSEAPSASPSPDEPVKPTPPAAMKGDDVAGAKAFVKYYFEVWDFAVATGNPAPLRRLALPSCVACKGVTTALDQAVSNGGSIEGGAHTVKRVAFNAPVEQAGTGIFQGNARVSNTKQTITDSGVKGLDGTYDADTVAYYFVVAKDRGDWRVSEWRMS